MSDLLAPLLFVLDDEVDAFWCFSAYMERVVSAIALRSSNNRQLLGFSFKKFSPCRV